MCDVTAAVVGATAVAGAAASASSKGGSKSSTTNSLSPPQQAAVDVGYTQSSKQYVAGMENMYGGAYTAAQNQNQADAASGLASYAKGTGTDLTRGVSSAAGTLLAPAGQVVANAGALATNGAAPTQSNGQGILNSAATGNTGVVDYNGALKPASQTAAQAGYGGATQSIGNAQGMVSAAQGDVNAKVAQGAGAYVNNDILQGQIDAANRDSQRQLTEDTLPGLNARAVMGGNLNSSRAGAAEAIARRGAADREADTAANIRASAYNNGVNASVNVNGQNNALALGANAQLQNGATIGNNVAQTNEAQRHNQVGEQTTAATNSGALDLGNRTLDAQTQLGANAQLGNAVGLGINGATSAGALATSTAKQLATAGDIQQAEEQRKLTEAQAQIENPQNRQAELLKNYWSVAGTNLNNGTQTTTQTNPSNIIGGALGGASLGAGLMSGSSGGTIGGYADDAAAGIGGLFAGNSNASGGALTSADPNLLPAKPAQGFGRYF